MHIVHGQAIGFHCFIFVSNDEIEWSSLISTGNEFLKETLPLRTEFTGGITSSGFDCKPMVLSLFTNTIAKLLTFIQT